MERGYSIHSYISGRGPTVQYSTVYTVTLAGWSIAQYTPSVTHTVHSTILVDQALLLEFLGQCFRLALPTTEDLSKTQFDASQYDEDAANDHSDPVWSDSLEYDKEDL